jgi:Ca2+-binding EF-hand superfamily protein
MRREFLKKEQKLGFDMIDVDGDGKIKIYDLIYNCSVFNKQSPLGS